MSDILVWITILLLTLASILTRSTFWLLGQHINIPTRVQQALRYAPACALVAIIVPDLVLSQTQVDLTLSNSKLIAGILAGIFYLWRRDMFLTIILGMACFTLLRLLPTLIS